MKDLIRREDAANLLYKMLADDYVDGYAYLEQLRSLPSAEPERIMKGTWIKEDLSGYFTPGGNSIYHCSECGHTEGPWPHPRLTNFCPSCGADMRDKNEKA